MHSLGPFKHPQKMLPGWSSQLKKVGAANFCAKVPCFHNKESPPEAPWRFDKYTCIHAYLELGTQMTSIFWRSTPQKTTPFPHPKQGYYLGSRYIKWFRFFSLSNFAVSLAWICTVILPRIWRGSPKTPSPLTPFSASAWSAKDTWRRDKKLEGPERSTLGEDYFGVHSGKLTNTAGWKMNHSSRCISYIQWGIFRPAMLVYRRVVFKNDLRTFAKENGPDSA